MIQYKGMVSWAKDDLRGLVSTMTYEFFKECLSINKIRSYWIINGMSKTKSDEMRQIDDYCLKPGCSVKDYTQICIVDVPLSQHPIEQLFRRFWVESDSDQIFSIVSRINKIKVFL